MGAAAAAASAASSSSCDLGTSLDPRRRCLLAQSPQQRRSRPRCQPRTCWSPRSGTDGKCWSPLKAWRGMSRSSCADVASPARSRRCGKLRCWTGRLRTELVEACRWRRRLTGSWCCPVGLSGQRTGAWEESRGVSALRSGPGSCWVRLVRPLGPLRGCCTKRGKNNIWRAFSKIKQLYSKSNQPGWKSCLCCLLVVLVLWLLINSMLMLLTQQGFCRSRGTYVPLCLARECPSLRPTGATQH